MSLRCIGDIKKSFSGQVLAEASKILFRNLIVYSWKGKSMDCKALVTKLVNLNSDLNNA